MTTTTTTTSSSSTSQPTLTLTEAPREPVSWPQPSHPSTIALSTSSASTSTFTTYAIAAADLPAGSLIATLSAATRATARSYATVQASRNSDIDLNSDLVYCNHSCAPNVVFDMTRREVRVGPTEVRKGEALTFFYPSTEWDMQQPFKCECGEGACVGVVRGAKWLSGEEVGRYWLNEHVRELLKEKNGAVPSQ